MWDASISQFNSRLVNQQRQINDCVFRRFDSSKYLTTLRSTISPCQKAVTLILISFYNPSSHLWKPSKRYWELPHFPLGCLLKSATVTSFSQLNLSRNSGSSWSLDQMNLHFLLFIQDDWSKKAKKCEKLSRFFVGMENFTFREMHVSEKSMGKS